MTMERKTLGEMRLVSKTMRVAATCATVGLLMGALFGVGGWRALLAHEEPEFSPPLFTLQVGEQGTTLGLWREGVEVKRFEDDQLTEATIRVPEHMADIIERTFQNEDSYETIEGAKLVRIVLVTSGSETTDDCHWHGWRYHCHEG